MSISNNIPLWMAEQAAAKVVELLTPACERIAIAGSVRRRKEVVGDIEIVAIARQEKRNDAPPGELLPRERIVNHLWQLTDEVRDGKYRAKGVARPEKREGMRSPAWGERLRMLAVEFSPGRWFPVDLFIVQKRSWGVQLALRTGPAEFSHRLVTLRCHNGAMPIGMRSKDGELQTRVDTRKPADDPDAWQGLYIDEETEFFKALELPFIEPHLRSERRLLAALKGAV